MDIRPDLQWVADILADADLEYKTYNQGIQFNVADMAGVIHSFYPTTGTILFHEGNARNQRKTATLRDQSIYTFISYLVRPDRIQNIIKEGPKWKSREA